MTSYPHARGFSLVEVTLAMGVAVFCLVVVFGLLSVGVNTSSISVQQTNASNLLALIASDLRTAPNTFPKGSASQTTLVYGLTVPAAASPSPAPTPVASVTKNLFADGQVAPASAPNAAYVLNVWVTPGIGRNAAVARVVLSWPGNVPIANAAGSVEAMVALDRN